MCIIRKQASEFTRYSFPFVCFAWWLPGGQLKIRFGEGALWLVGIRKLEACADGYIRSGI